MRLKIFCLFLALATNIAAAQAQDARRAPQQSGNPAQHFQPASRGSTAAARAALPAAEAAVNFVSAQQLLADIRKAPEAAPHIATKSYLDAPGYQAVVVRRTAPGGAEVHKHMMDIWYVIDGGGELVTGGSPIEARETGPGELRGSGISGGRARHVSKGDFVTIPAGVPHWVRGIDGKEIIYLVVKVKP
jgi:mannose-6-phosphate isomerase-like protein (cupin superfamily)